VPRPAPRRRSRLASRSMAFPRRPVPAAPEPEPVPPLRRATPAGEVGEPAAPAAVGDGAPGVRKRGFVLPAVAAVMAAFAAGTGYLAVTDDSPSSDLVGRWASVTAAAAGAERPAGDPFGSVAAIPAGAPTRLRVAAIGVDTSLDQLHLGPDGALKPPNGYGKAGWYADGTAPGDTGPAVIAGHVDSRSGPAIFYRLRELTTGDVIEVARGGRTLRFTVTRTAWYPKAGFPTGLVYGPTPDRQLRLITCGGVFDHTLRSYKDNLVVYAVAG
jgi:hypothetical protein